MESYSYKACVIHSFYKQSHSECNLLRQRLVLLALFCLLFRSLTRDIVQYIVYIPQIQFPNGAQGLSLNIIPLHGMMAVIKFSTGFTYNKCISRFCISVNFSVSPSLPRHSLSLLLLYFNQVEPLFYCISSQNFSQFGAAFNEHTLLTQSLCSNIA